MAATGKRVLEAWASDYSLPVAIVIVWRFILRFFSLRTQILKNSIRSVGDFQELIILCQPHLNVPAETG
jgi:hypothetical protein